MNLTNYCININSKDRTNQQDDTNKPSFIIRDLINERGYKKSYLSMPYATFPPTIYNITTKNNTLTVVENTTPVTIALTFVVTIPAGNYNISSFITALTTAMTAQSALFGYVNTYTGTYDGVTGKLTISIVGLPVNRQFTYTLFTIPTSLMQFLGFNRSYENITVANLTNTLTGPFPVNFITQSSIFVRCSIWRNNTSYDTSDQNGSSNIMAQIPITGNGFNQVVYLNGYEGVPDKKIEIENVMNSTVTFFITDEYNNLIDMNGWDWQAQLMFQLQK